MGRAAASHPDVRILPRNPSSRDVRAIAECLWALIASSERALDGTAIWGEGWRCRFCAKERPADERGACPSCGADDWAVVNDPEWLLATVARALKPRSDWQPIACVLEREGQLVGYAFGAVTTPQRAVHHLREKIGEFPDKLAKCGIDLARIDLQPAVPAQVPVFYAGEVGVTLGARNGMESFKALSAVLLAGAAELGARGLVGFTGKRTVLREIAIFAGAEMVLDLDEFLVFRMDDFLPLVALFHHLSTDELINLLAQSHS